MGILALTADERVADVKFTTDTLSVRLHDGRTITVPLTWNPRLFNATVAQRKNWQIAVGGYGIHWPDIDENLSTEGLLRAHLPHIRHRPKFKAAGVGGRNAPPNRSRIFHPPVLRPKEVNSHPDRTTREDAGSCRE